MAGDKKVVGSQHLLNFISKLGVQVAVVVPLVDGVMDLLLDLVVIQKHVLMFLERIEELIF